MEGRNPEYVTCPFDIPLILAIKEVFPYYPKP